VLKQILGGFCSIRKADFETQEDTLWRKNMSFSVMLQQLSTGMIKSIEIFALTLIFSLPLGLLISFGRMSKYKVVSTIFKIYISLMRGTPLMLQLLVVYFGPYYLF